MNTSVATAVNEFDTPLLTPARRAFALNTPAALREALPVSIDTAARIQNQRAAIRAVLRSGRVAGLITDETTARALLD